MKRTLGDSDGEDAAVAAHLDIRSIRLDVVDGLFVEATIDTRGAVPADGARAMNGVTYRIAFDTKTPPATEPARATSFWTISGATCGTGTAAYTAVGRGVYPQVTVSGNTIAVRGVLPGPLANASSVRVFATASSAPAAGLGCRVLSPTTAPRSGVLTGSAIARGRFLERVIGDGVSCRLRGLPLVVDTGVDGRGVHGDQRARRQVRLHRVVFRLPRRQP